MFQKLASASSVFGQFLAFRDATRMMKGASYAGACVLMVCCFSSVSLATVLAYWNSTTDTLSIYLSSNADVYVSDYSGDVEILDEASNVITILDGSTPVDVATSDVVNLVIEGSTDDEIIDCRMCQRQMDGQP